MVLTNLLSTKNKAPTGPFLSPHCALGESGGKRGIRGGTQLGTAVPHPFALTGRAGIEFREQEQYPGLLQKVQNPEFL
jgi:hypothetical protein